MKSFRAPNPNPGTPEPRRSLPSGCSARQTPAGRQRRADRQRRRAEQADRWQRARSLRHAAGRRARRAHYQDADHTIQGYHYRQLRAYFTCSGHVRTTHVDAVAQFRPWASHGFLLKGGAGMAFVRNWVDAAGPNAINSKVLWVVIGGGWHAAVVIR